MYVVGVPVLCVLRGLPARKEQQKEKARTSFSKGERQRESKGKDKHSKEIYSPMLRTSRGGSRKANQIASEKQIASSKQSTKYVDGRTKNEAARHHRSTTAKQSTYSTTPKQSTTSSQLGGETPSSAALQGSGSHLCVFFFFPALPPVLLLVQAARRRPSYAHGRRTYAAGSRRDCPF